MNSPELVVATLDVALVATFTTVSAASTMAAPVGSVTAPVMLPRSLCAKAAVEIRSAITALEKDWNDMVN